MSADNGIYILPIHYPNGKISYLVNHCQGINEVFCNSNREDGYNNEYIKSYFMNSDGEFDKLEDAMKCAEKMHDDIVNDDFAGICEYGISILNSLIITIKDPYPFFDQFGQSKVEKTKVEVPENHMCKLDSQWNNYGPSITECWTDGDGHMWAGTDEYSSRVNFCPICGIKAVVPINC